MFLIKTYRTVLTLLITALDKAAEKKHEEARRIEAALKALRAKQIVAQSESAQLAVESVRLKALLG